MVFSARPVAVLMLSLLACTIGAEPLSFPDGKGHVPEVQLLVDDKSEARLLVGGVRLDVGGAERLTFLISGVPESGYCYRLAGWEGQCHPLMASSSAVSYERLPEGDYRFELLPSGGSVAVAKTSYLIWLHRPDPLWFRALTPLSVLLILLLWLPYRRLRSRWTQFDCERAALAADNRSLEQERERLLTQNQGLQSLFARIMHEIKTPITLIAAPLPQLRELSGERMAPQLQQMSRGIERLHALLCQLIQHSSEQGLVHSSRHTLLLQAWLLPRLEMYREMAAAKEIGWQATLPPDVAVTLDAQLLEDGLQNLLGNAIKYSQAGGEIVLESRLDEEHSRLCFSVRDSGIGIEPCWQASLFSTSLRTPEAIASGAEGAGLGLYLLHQRIEKAGGELKLVSSEPGKGSEFFLCLPCAWSRLGSAMTQVAAPARELAADAPLLLIVEDDPDLQQLLQHWLGEEYRIMLSASIRGGVALAREELPDLVLCDLMLPDGEGYRLLEELKQGTETSHIPIVICSAMSEESCRVNVWKACGDDFIAKPFDPRLLSLRLRALRENRKQLQSWFTGHIAAEPDPVVTKALRPAAISPVDAAFSQQLRELVCELLQQDQLSLELLAVRFCMSSRTLQRKIQALFGLSYSDYQRELQLQLVIDHLQRGLSIKEAAARSGFRDQAYLSRVFKQKLGVTPSEYRKQHLGAAAAKEGAGVAP